MSTSKNYNQGKKNEKDSWPVMEKKGFIKPTSKQKKNIKFAFESVGKTIKTRGYDLVRTELLPFLEDKNFARLNVDKIVLYELKTAGADREEILKEDFSNFKFTYSGNEEYNHRLLGDKQYKFIFLNLATKKARLLKESDWKPQARVYPTTSIFLTQPVNGQTL
jgi:hypothetical protein